MKMNWLDKGTEVTCLLTQFGLYLRGLLILYNFSYMNRRLFSFLAICLVFFTKIYSQNAVLLDTVTVASDLVIPWDIEWIGNDQLLVTERGGTVSRIDIQSNTTTPLLTLEVAEETHSGLMGMALHPAWPDSNAVFLLYSYYTPVFAINMRIERFRHEAANDTLVSEGVMLGDITGGSSTTGGRLLSTADGYLFATVGDIDNGILAQDSSSFNGKILRIHLDGTIPSDNPISGSSVYSLGHRNPQGLATGNGLIYSSEHGPSSTDEVNIIENGRNYGWPQVLGFCDAASAQVCQDLNVKEPSEIWSSPPIAPAGIAYYGSGGNSAWENSLLMASLRGQNLIRLILSADGTEITATETYLDGTLGRLRDVAVSPLGRVFVCTSNRDILGQPITGDDRVVELKLLPLSIKNELELEVGLESLNSDTWKISLPSGFSGGRLNVYEISGRLVRQQKLKPGAKFSSISLSGMTSGIFVLQIESPSGYWTQKISHD